MKEEFNIKNHIREVPDYPKPGTKVVVLDDLLATGGTLRATIELARKAGADVLAAATIIEPDFLKGRSKIDVPVISVVSYGDEEPAQTPKLNTMTPS